MIYLSVIINILKQNKKGSNIHNKALVFLWIVMIHP